MPTALDVPNIEVAHVETLSPFTELGTKGMGEAPIIGSKVAVIDAIEDALSPLNIVITETPATKERVWRLISNAMANRER
jgi:carbon-monoxide dehydrogenase large subunit